jgi:hypothetical protein
MSLTLSIKVLRAGKWKKMSKQFRRNKAMPLVTELCASFPQEKLGSFTRKAMWDLIWAKWYQCRFLSE